jgi:ankyrin repeat protein
MTEISYDEIPKFLHNADLFQDLDKLSSEKFILKYYKEDDSINSIDDLLLYFQVIDYCCLNSKYISIHIYESVFLNRYEIMANSTNLELISHINKYEDIKYLLNLNDNESDRITYCAEKNYLSCIKVLLNYFYPWDEYTSMVAAKEGHIECLIYLYEFYNKNKLWSDKKEFPWGDVCLESTKRGNLNILKYAIENGCILNTFYCGISICNIAIIYGHVNCLEYLLKIGYMCDSSSFAIAAKEGHLDCLIYIHKNGCLYNDIIIENAIEYAIKHNNLDCLEYLKKHLKKTFEKNI